MQIRPIYLLIISISLFSCKSTKTKISETSIQKSINKEANELLQNPSINAISIGIYYKGQEITDHFGILDKEKTNLPNNETIYEIASVTCLLYTSPSPRDATLSRMPSSA